MAARDAFKGRFLPEIADLGLSRRGSLADEWTLRAHKLLAAETERWVRKALEAGPGWGAWRSNPRTKDGDVFVIVHDFALVAPGAPPPGAGVIYEQPPLTSGERARLLAGRHDWREEAWQDECGEADCRHPCCIRYRESM